MSGFPFRSLLCHLIRKVDVRMAKRYTDPIPLVTKIEKEEAVADLDAIIDESRGIMIARGDLGGVDSPFGFEITFSQRCVDHKRCRNGTW